MQGEEGRFKLTYSVGSKHEILLSMECRTATLKTKELRCSCCASGRAVTSGRALCECHMRQ